MDWDIIADKETLEKTVNALRSKKIDVIVVDNGNEAKEKLLSLIKVGSTVMEASSTTLKQIGAHEIINESGRFVPLNKEISKENDSAKRAELRRALPSPDYAVGSVHAVTEDGQMLIASASGSQLPSYSFTAKKVILAVGTQKIVKNIDLGIRRIYEHSLPMETERMMKAYGTSSSVNQILIIEKGIPGRITVIFVKERLGF
ncbi:MAG: lactate utilization protein [Candidatus Marsarchaeota archaeon]|nr:lactate utilization protein [Candidatus Marsarchaeota archaeon]